MALDGAQNGFGRMQASVLPNASPAAREEKTSTLAPALHR